MGVERSHVVNVLLYEVGFVGAPGLSGAGPLLSEVNGGDLGAGLALTPLVEA